MGTRTKNYETMFRTGERLRECREWRGLSRDKLIERVEALPDNRGKIRSVKQIAYIENGTRPLSSEYALLLSQALNIRIEYLLLKDNYRTEAERIGAHVANGNEKQNLIIELMKLHFYEVEDATQRMPVEVDEDGKEYRKTTLALKSPKGSVRFLSMQELLEILKNIDDFIDYQCAIQFRKMVDGVNNIYEWEV